MSLVEDISASLKSMLELAKSRSNSADIVPELQALVDRVNLGSPKSTSLSAKTSSANHQKSSPLKKQTLLTKELTEEVQKLKGALRTNFFIFQFLRDYM